MNITDRLNRLVQARRPEIGARGIKKDLANSCKISYEAVRQWFAGDTGNIKNEHLVSIAQEYDTTVDWLLIGSGEPPIRSPAPVTAAPLGPLPEFYDPDKHLVIPRYDASGSMGDGIVLPEHIQVIEQMVVSRDWLRKQNLVHTGIPRLAITTGIGDSMKGTFSDGDPLLVDSGVNTFEADGIYFFSIDGAAHIKRLQRIGGGKVKVISDNPVYERWEADISQVIIHAKVLIGLNVRKME